MTYSTILLIIIFDTQIYAQRTEVMRTLWSSTLILAVAFAGENIYVSSKRYNATVNSSNIYNVIKIVSAEEKYWIDKRTIRSKMVKQMKR